MENNRAVSKFVIASVAPDQMRQWLASVLADHYADVPVDWLESRARCCGVKLAYSDPSQFGVDRFCALIAARQRCPDQAVVVVNAGTAVTVDYLAASGQHEGGVIMPSLAAMKAGLNQLAPSLRDSWSLPPVKKRKRARWLASNTAEALQLGCHWMLVSALDEMLDAMSAQASPQPVALIMGGGDAAQLATLLGSDVQLVEHLVLEGMKELSRRHR